MWTQVPFVFCFFCRFILPQPCVRYISERWQIRCLCGEETSLSCRFSYKLADGCFHERTALLFNESVRLTGTLTSSWSCSSVWAPSHSSQSPDRKGKETSSLWRVKHLQGARHGRGMTGFPKAQAEQGRTHKKGCSLVTLWRSHVALRGWICLSDSRSWLDDKKQIVRC